MLPVALTAVVEQVTDLVKKGLLFVVNWIRNKKAGMTIPPLPSLGLVVNLALTFGVSFGVYLLIGQEVVETALKFSVDFAGLGEYIGPALITVLAGLLHNAKDLLFEFVGKIRR